VLFTLALCAPAGGEAPRSPDISVALEPVIERGLERPVYVTHAPDGSGRLVVLEQSGRIRIVQDGRLSRLVRFWMVSRPRWPSILPARLGVPSTAARSTEGTEYRP
jgi:hypothetical protein